VRDRDVALARLHKLTAGLPSRLAAWSTWLARLESERLGSAGALAAMLDRLQLEGFPRNLPR